MMEKLKDYGIFHANVFQSLEGILKEEKKEYTNSVAVDNRKVEAMEHIIEVCKTK